MSFSIAFESVSFLTSKIPKRALQSMKTQSSELHSGSFPQEQNSTHLLFDFNDIIIN